MLRFLSLLSFLLFAINLYGQNCTKAKDCWSAAQAMTGDQKLTTLRTAKQLAEKQEDINPLDHAMIISDIGLLKMIAKEYDSAFFYLDKARELDKTNLSSYVLPFQHYHYKGDTATAMQWLNNGVDNVEYPTEMWFEAASYFKRLKDYKQAAYYFEKAQNTIPYTSWTIMGGEKVFAMHTGDTRIGGGLRADVHYNLADMRRRLNPKDSTLISTLNLALKEQPTHKGALLERAIQYYYAGRYTQSMNDLLLYDKTYPNSSSAYYYFGANKQAQGKWFDAANSYLQAYNLNKKDLQALNLGTYALWKYAAADNAEWSKYYNTIVDNYKILASSNNSKLATQARSSLKQLSVPGY